MSSLHADMNKALVELAQVAEELGRASIVTQRARNEETTLLNRMNQAQAQVDALMATVKKQAPRDSEWHRARRPGTPA